MGQATAYVDLSGVSDDDYPSDFSYGLADSTQKVFPKTAGVRYQTEKSTLLARMQKFQYLKPASEPYERPLQLQWRYKEGFLNDRLKWKMLADYSYFDHSALSKGSRWVMHHSLSYPVYKLGYFMVPQIDLHSAYYRLNQPVDANVSTKTRFAKIIPTLSYKMGAYFDKNLDFNDKKHQLSLNPYPTESHPWLLRYLLFIKVLRCWRQNKAVRWLGIMITSYFVENVY